jgi:Domain of unknown function (DUF4340)
MAYIKTVQKRKVFSNLMLIGFLFLVAATSLLSNALKIPIKTNKEIIEQSKVFNITKLTLKNKSGEYIFERTDTATPWHMTSPKELSANSFFIEKLFSSLNVIKTKKLLPDDKANNSNFSLDKPTAILTLTNGVGTNIVLDIGIMNTIDNSTYLKITNRQGIYHVEAPSIALENVTLNDLIEATIFDFDLKSISSFKLYKKSATAAAQFEVETKSGFWTGVSNAPLNPLRLDDLLNDFFTINSTHALDKQSDAGKKQTQALLASPEYIIKVQKGEETLTYRISKPITSLIDITLNDEPHFLIEGSGGDIVYVVKNEFYHLFELKNDGLKALEVQPTSN